MQSAVKIPVTVKARIGIDELDSYEFLCDFIEKVQGKGCQEFIIHAQKAAFRVKSQKKSRNSAIRLYSGWYQLKRDFPHLTIAINGGIKPLKK